MNAAQAKELDLPALLHGIGARAKDQGTRQGVWFYSPFREENTPSFKVWQQPSGLWCWKDFGSGEGGNVIAFANRMVGKDINDRAISEALEWLDRQSGGRVAGASKRRMQTPAMAQIEPVQTDRFTLIDNKRLRNPQLCNYLSGRGIHPHYGQLYCGQANYLDTVTKKKFYGISFPNIDGGLEIRAASQYKLYANTGPKNFSFIPGQDKAAINLAIFEGFIDFLSYLTIIAENKPPHPVIVLNSVSFVGRAADHLARNAQQEGYPVRLVQTFFDHDVSGQKAYDTLYEALEPQGFSVTDERHRYEGYHDVNKFLQDASGMERAKFGNRPAPAKFYDSSTTSEMRRFNDAQRENTYKPKPR